MRIRTKEEKALDEAMLRVQHTKAWVTLKVNSGGLSDEDRLRVRAELNQANDALPPPREDKSEPGLLLLLRIATVLGFVFATHLVIEHSVRTVPLSVAIAFFVILSAIVSVPLPQRWLRSRAESQGEQN